MAKSFRDNHFNRLNLRHCFTVATQVSLISLQRRSDFVKIPTKSDEQFRQLKNFSVAFDGNFNSEIQKPGSLIKFWRDKKVSKNFDKVNCGQCRCRFCQRWREYEIQNMNMSSAVSGKAWSRLVII